MTLSPWIVMFIFISLPGAYGLKLFPEKFVVATKLDTKPVTLTCGMGSDGAVTWQFEHDPNVEEWGNVQRVGRNLNVRKVDDPMVGEYSCWNGGEKLSSTYLLFDTKNELSEFQINCRAKSYNCNFSCHWTHSGFTAVRLRLGPECTTEDAESCSWVSRSGQLPDGGFQFELSHTLPPFAEESTMLEVTAQAISGNTILRMTEKFFLRDIVQPDSPIIVRCQEEDEKLNVTIHPASSWSTPHSYFNLEHEIEYMYKDNDKTESSTSHLIPKDITKLRVRSRDSLVLSPWSQWTPWKKVRTGKKNLCKKKKTKTLLSTAII